MRPDLCTRVPHIICAKQNQMIKPPPHLQVADEESVVQQFLEDLSRVVLCRRRLDSLDICRAVAVQHILHLASGVHEQVRKGKILCLRGIGASLGDPLRNIPDSSVLGRIYPRYEPLIPYKELVSTDSK